MCSGKPQKGGVDEQMSNGCEREKMPSTEEATSSKRAVATLVSSAGTEWVVGAML